jgi:ATP-dependent Clp protease ATP-binding subunit ClpC
MFKIRLAQMRMVERAVRTVRVSTARKRKMREELLAHLSAIYDQEHARLHDSGAALNQAAIRFGDPAELAREFERSITWNERVAYYFERWYGWRAPESATRFMLRVSANLFIALLPACAVELAADGGLLRPALALLLFAPAIHFAVGLSYFKMRDALHGAFGRPKSLSHVFALDLLIAMIVLLGGFGFIATAAGITQATNLLGVCAIAAVISAIVYLHQARTRGPTEISDTLWALLNI